MKKSSVFAAVLGALVAGTLCTGLSASAAFRLPADMEDADYSTLPNTQTGIIYTNDAVYAGETTRTGLIVVLQPGASFPEEILAKQADEEMYEGLCISALKYPWMGFFDQYLPYYEGASSFREGEFERYFDAWRLSTTEDDVCGTIYRDKLSDYDLSQCWMMVPCLLNGQPLYDNMLAWDNLCTRLEDSPAVQGIYVVGYTKTEPVAPAGSFQVYTTVEDDLKIEEIKELKLANYPDFQIDEIAMPDRINFYNDEFILNVSGLDENDTVGYHTAWTAINDWLQERTDENQISICEMNTESLDAQPSFTPFLDTFYETLAPSVRVPLQAYVGDTNGDNRISVADVVLLSRYVAQDEDLRPEQTAAILRNGQCDNDGEINAMDTATLSKCIAGLVPQEALGPYGGKDYGNMTFTISEQDLDCPDAMTFGFLANNKEYWFGSDCIRCLSLVFSNGDEVPFSDALRYGLVSTEQLVRNYGNWTLYEKPIGSADSEFTKVPAAADEKIDYSTMDFTIVQNAFNYDTVMTLGFVAGETEYWFGSDCIGGTYLKFANNDWVPLTKVLQENLVPTERLVQEYPNATLYEKPVGADMSALKMVYFGSDKQFSVDVDYSEMAFTIEMIKPSSAYDDVMTLAFENEQTEYWLSCDCISNLQLCFANGNKIPFATVLEQSLVPTARLVTKYPGMTLYEKPVDSDASALKKVELADDAQIDTKTDYKKMAFTVEEIQPDKPQDEMMTLAFICGESEYWFSCACISNLRLVFANGDQIPFAEVLEKQLVPTERLIVPYPNITLYKVPVGDYSGNYEKVVFETK